MIGEEKKLVDIGETGIVELIENFIDYPDSAVLDYGDDASGFALGDKIVLLKIDGFSIAQEKLPWNTMFDVGWKAITMVSSDLICKGSTPLGFMVSVGLDEHTFLSELMGLLEGASSSARAHGGWLIGGDLNESKDPWVSVCGIGVGSTRPPPRRGARPGDLVVVTEMFGLTGAGFHAYSNGISMDELPPDIRESIIKATSRPVAPLVFLSLVARLDGNISASMDSSDGLAFSLHEISKSSGYKIEVSRLPAHPNAVKYAEEFNADLEELVFYGGEEFQTVFTVDENVLGEVVEVLGEDAVIGRVLDERGCGVLYGGKALSPRGWRYFGG